jgi:hypothetical protein
MEANMATYGEVVSGNVKMNDTQTAPCEGRGQRILTQLTEDRVMIVVRRWDAGDTLLEVPADTLAGGALARSVLLYADLHRADLWRADLDELLSARPRNRRRPQ